MKKVEGVIKLQAPFEKIKEHTNDPVERLYRAVIMQMIIDASNKSQKKDLIRNEEDAKKWLFEENEYFDWACVNANLNKDYVRKIAKKIIDRDF